MFKRILSVLFLSLMVNTANAYFEDNLSADDLANIRALLTPEQQQQVNNGEAIESLIGLENLVALAVTGGVELSTIASSLSSIGYDANAVTFAMVSAGADADSVVNAVTGQFPGTTSEALATTLVEAKINYNLRTGTTTTDDTSTARTAFTSAVSAGGGSPLTTDEFIKITSSS